VGAAGSRAETGIEPMNIDRTDPPEPPRRTVADGRGEREAETLRANLRKRKEQQRAREVPTGGDSTLFSEDVPGSDA
jgi:hypothetical protein